MEQQILQTINNSHLLDRLLSQHVGHGLQVSHAMRQADGQLPVQERRHLDEHFLLGGEVVLPGEAHLSGQEISSPGVDQSLEAYPAKKATRKPEREIDKCTSR